MQTSNIGAGIIACTIFNNGSNKTLRQTNILIQWRGMNNELIYPLKYQNNIIEHTLIFD